MSIAVVFAFNERGCFQRFARLAVKQEINQSDINRGKRFINEPLNLSSTTISSRSLRENIIKLA